MNALIKWSSLQKSVSKFTPKQFNEIDPRRSKGWIALGAAQLTAAVKKGVLKINWLPKVLFLGLTLCFTMFFGKNIFLSIWIHQLQVSANSWQHQSQICFATFIQCKITKLVITQQPLKLEKKKAQIWNPYDLRFFKIQVCTKLKKYSNVTV